MCVGNVAVVVVAGVICASKLLISFHAIAHGACAPGCPKLRGPNNVSPHQCKTFHRSTRSRSSGASDDDDDDGDDRQECKHNLYVCKI